MPARRNPLYLINEIGGGGGGNAQFSQTFFGATSIPVSHNLGYTPDVNVRDLSGNTVTGSIVHQDSNSFTVNFNIPVDGIIYYS